MPNRQNIESPITLFGTGRSGTSVLYRAVCLHPDVEGAGESANLIFTTWRALEQISGLTRYGRIENKDFGADAMGLVRNAFLTVFPSNKREWMHKPIGLPRIYSDFGGVEPDTDSFAAWYWNVFQRCFPASRNMAILRNPMDVVISACKYYGEHHADSVWRSLRFAYHALALGRQDIRIAVHYSDMVAEPAAVLKRVCDAVELEFDARMIEAFEKLHVPARRTMFGTAEDLSERRKSGFMHLEERDSLRMDDSAKRTVERYHDLLAMFGLPPDGKPDAPGSAI